MAFTEFKTLAQVSERFQITALADSLFPEFEQKTPSGYLGDQLAFAKSRRKAGKSEQYMREWFISPVLMEALRDYQWLNIWINEFELSIDDQLNGLPDYLLTSLPQPKAIDTAGQLPYVAIAEAKRENFSEGWGQCLAELYACQRLNGDPNLPVWGIVTNGETWQFGKLKGAEFTRHDSSIDLDPLGKLLAVLHYIFKQCDDAARKAAGADNNSNAPDF